MDFHAITDLIHKIAHWLETHPVISPAIFSMLGAIISAVFNFRKRTLDTLKKFKIVTKSVDKSQQFQEQSMDDSPGASQQVAGRDVNNYFSTGARIGTEAEALSVPLVSDTPLDGEQDLLCEKIRRLCEHHHKTYDPQPDYELAVTKLKGGHFKAAAVIYISVFNNSLGLFNSTDIYKNAGQELAILSTAINNLLDIRDGKTIEGDMEQKFKDVEQAALNILSKEEWV